MFVLSESEFKSVKRQLTNAPSFVYAVLDQIIPGRVYVDSVNRNSLLIGSETGIFYVMGDESNTNFNEFLLELYLSKCKYQTRFTLFSSSTEWDERINHLWGKNDLNLERYKRYAFIFKPTKYTTQKIPLPKEYSVERMNAVHIKQSLEFGEPYYQKYWESVSHFLEKGFGYCIQHNGKIVSECTSIFRSNQFAEIDIATNQEYVGKGLAYRSAQAFIDHCMSNQLIPRWDCDVNNKASILLGKKLGFEIANEYSVFTKKI